MTEIDRTEVAHAPRREALLAAGVGGLDRAVVPGVAHPVVPVHEEHPRFGACPGALDDRVPDLFGLERLIDDRGTAFLDPGIQVTIPIGVVFRIGGVRKDGIPLFVGTNRRHELIGDADADVGVGDLPHLPL